MSGRFPVRPSSIQLGIGLDLAWGQDPGLVSDPVRGDVVSDSTVAAIERHAADCSHLSVCWQPRRRRHVEARHYFHAYDDLFARIGHRFSTRALHHTALSRRAAEAYRCGELLEVTQALVERYDFAWVDEDVGLWPIQGKPPEATGPKLDEEGLSGAIRHARVVRAGLSVPLMVGFPSFACAEGATMHAYDFFRTLADEADIAVTFDAARMLSYQWHRGKRGADMLSELDKLPLQRCFEIQVSASDAKSGRAFEGSDETLFEAQIELVQLLSKRCSNVRVVAYDGPLVRPDGNTSVNAGVGLARLRDIVSAWSGRKPSGGFELRA